jgi:hypothetical protein
MDGIRNYFNTTSVEDRIESTVEDLDAVSTIRNKTKQSGKN